MTHSPKLFTVVAALAGLLMASQAQAVSETFNFSTSGAWTTNDLGFTSNSGNQTVTAGGFSGGTFSSVGADREYVGTNGSGLVVCSGTGSGTGAALPSNCAGDEHTIDSNAPDEDVKLTFLSEVTLLSMTVTYWDGLGDTAGDQDDFSLFTDGVAQETTIYIPSMSDNGAATYLFSSLIGADVTGTMFHIGARGQGDTFKVQSLTVDFPGASGGQVPEPSTILLFGSGLAGLGLWRMKKGKKG